MAEMKLVNFHNYTKAARRLWSIGVNNTFPSMSTSPAQVLVYHHKKQHHRRSNFGLNGHLLLGTEDPLVLTEATLWANTYNWTIQYTNVIDRARLKSANFQMDKSKPQFEVRNPNGGSFHGHHELEYFSILLNIHYMLQCDAFVHTMGSNFNRILDALKNTVAGKANRMSIELDAGRGAPYLYVGLFRGVGGIGGLALENDLND